jgi:transcriptional regulator with XRE-family HTH domain
MNIRLKTLRAEAGLTQKQLAEKINSTDKSVWAYEKGIATPPIETLIAYAKFFNVSVDYLIGLEDDFGVRAISSINEQYTQEEQKIIDKYRQLDIHGKKLINQTLDTLLIVKK